ncbi:hypothetical protein KQH60_08150 [Mycetohabitans sp. B8]|uniref:hypothetical protein n=1 Tax=Mycetohabitans sp. B8 TaxID=2841845 RepID=UPI001F3D3284|nr:hypothetical protein [Mycetohabitans sp. B8]MCG1042518.1 hypothetical protein [Mycetohabitans sp. B8]
MKPITEEDSPLRRLCELMEKRPAMTMKEMAISLEVSQGLVNRCVHQLIADRYLRHAKGIKRENLVSSRSPQYFERTKKLVPPLESPNVRIVKWRSGGAQKIALPADPLLAVFRQWKAG